MTNRQSDTRNVKETARELLAREGKVTAGQVARASLISRQAAHLHLRAMTASGELRLVGAGRGAHYVLDATSIARFSIPGLDEDGAWRETLRAAPALSHAPEPWRRIAQYGLTEMVNNAIDHSGGSFFEVALWLAAPHCRIEVRDDGVGAYRRARDTFGLVDDLAAVAEFLKGKRTTMPDRHSGEGIFFTSKTFDRFTLTANGIRWTVDNILSDQALGDAVDVPGTRVALELSLDTDRQLAAVFDAFSLHPLADPAFDRTRTRVAMTRAGSAFLSRSEAKRLGVGLDKFAEVELDFAGVTDVGQGFVDELFRVWSRDHPGTRLVPVNMSPAVRLMIERGLAFE